VPSGRGRPSRRLGQHPRTPRCAESGDHCRRAAANEEAREPGRIRVERA
jgi:hypothetical protein